MKKFVMYGAGNIGRGFIGQLFSNAGYNVGFVDINKEVLDRLNTDGQYPVNVVTSDSNEEQIVKNVYGIDGGNSELIANEINECELMATAIGVNVLKFTAKPIALGIEKRKNRNAPPLNIIICENLLGADEYLKGLVKQQKPELSDYIDENVGFVEASIGRMVPVVTEEKRQGNPLRVYVEPYNILPVDKLAFKGEALDIENLYPFSPFSLFIERKLFMHNMSHAITSYLGYLKSDEYIYESISDFEVRFVAYKALTTMAVALARENKTEIKGLLEHAENLLYRFQNKALGDTVSRVGRDTQRKLGANDRLIGALKLAEKQGIGCEYLCIGIAAAMLFNPNGDESSKELCSYTKENGAKSALLKYSEYAGNSVALIETLYNMLKQGKQLTALIKYCDNLTGKELKV